MRKLAFLVILAAALTGVSLANEQLAKQKGCMACHDMKAKKVGPAYAEVAKKYAGRKDAVDYLTQKIKKGGAGVWGGVPMPPQNNVTDAEAKQIAQWIMSVK